MADNDLSYKGLYHNIMYFLLSSRQNNRLSLGVMRDDSFI